MMHGLEYLHHLDECTKSDYMIIFISWLWIFDLVSENSYGWEFIWLISSSTNMMGLVTMRQFTTPSPPHVDAKDGNSDHLSVGQLLDTIQVCWPHMHCDCPTSDQQCLVICSGHLKWWNSGYWQICSMYPDRQKLCSQPNAEFLKRKTSS